MHYEAKAKAADGDIGRQLVEHQSEKQANKLSLLM